jgi:hypothetical protein
VSALLAGALALAAAVAGGRWYTALREDLVRERVEREADAVATSIESVVSSRLTVLHGLASFLRLEWGAPTLNREFDIFAEGVLRNVPGLRTVQYVQDGVIRYTWPLRGNEAAVGEDLLADPRPQLVADFRRALDTTAIVVSGPVALYQGSVGLIGRLAVRDPDDSVLVVAAAVIEFGTVIDESGLRRSAEGLDLRLRAADDSLLWTSGSTAPLGEPVRVGVNLSGQQWSLLATPAGGWLLGSTADRRAYRFGAGMVVLLIAGLAWGMQSRLRARVESSHLRELSRAEQKFQELFQLVPDGVIVTRESDHRIIEVNDAYCAIVQRPRSALIGQPTTVLGIWTRPGDRDTVLETVRDRGSVQEFPFLVSRPDGSSREAVLSSSRVIFDGEPCLLGVVRDVHDRLRLERRLVEGQRLEAVGRLAGGVAHDFNNLITGMSGYADILFESLDREDPRRPEVTEIQRACARAADLTRQLLTFARRQVVLPKLVDLNQVVREAESLLRRLSEPVATLLVEPSGDPLPVMIDPAQFEQVITNLTVNARDAMPDGGPIQIRTEREEEQAVLSVTDAGVGIPSEAIPHLFEPFYTTKPAGKGTGLGLATVYGIVEQAGGRLEVRSEPGRGSTFRVILPLAEGGADLVQPATPATPPMPRGRETLLVVDDEPQIRDLGARILARLGYQVLTERDGRAALELLDRRPDVALVITDLIMPGMGGWELVTHLRERDSRLRIVVMSGYSEDLVGALQDAVFLPKPFTASELATAVREALDHPGTTTTS